MTGPPPAGPPPAVPPPAGAAGERTALAWRRTTLAATVVALLFVRLAWTRAAPELAALAVPGWLAVLAVARHRTASVSTATDAGPNSDAGLGRAAPLLALAVAGVAVFGMALVVLP